MASKGRAHIHFYFTSQKRKARHSRRDKYVSRCLFGNPLSDFPEPKTSDEDCGRSRSNWYTSTGKRAYIYPGPRSTKRLDSIIL